MKHRFQWKDPDFDWEHNLTNEEWEKLHALGIGEYIVLEVDTDLGTVTVLTPKKRKS